jgi:hypothetical protein
VENQFCFEHGGRTCCGERDVIPIRNKMALVRHQSSPKINDVCYAVTSRAHCSICDADIGTGIN